MGEPGVDELRARADAGDRAAMTALGKRLLGNVTGLSDMRDGAAYVARAAALEDAEALAQHAALVAAGMQNEPSWERAMQLLQRAAELGWAPAQEDLRLLAGAQGNDFAAMVAGADLEAWRRGRPQQLVSDAPRILTVESFLSRAECARLIDRVRGKMDRARVFDPASGVGMVAKERTNSKSEIMPTETDIPFLLAHARISATTGLPAPFFELPNVLHYLPGQQFTPHYDFLDPQSPGLAADIRSRGQRIVTFLVYLNDDYEGGETDFPELGYRFKGKTGDALMFGNVDPKGAPEPRTLHAGLPPTSGEKWLLSQWVRNRAPSLDAPDRV